jgi:hypothetical protein
MEIANVQERRERIREEINRIESDIRFKIGENDSLRAKYERIPKERNRYEKTL